MTSFGDPQHQETTVNPDTSLFQSRKIVTITTIATKFHQDEFYRVFTAYKQNRKTYLVGTRIYDKIYFKKYTTF